MLLPLLLTLSCLVQKYDLRFIYGGLIQSPLKLTRASQTSLVVHELQVNAVVYIEWSGAVLLSLIELK